MWSASVKDKQLQDGKLILVLEYTNKDQSLKDTVILTSAQTIEWVSDQMAARVLQLNGLQDFHDSLVEGPVDVSAKVSALENLNATIIAAQK